MRIADRQPGRPPRAAVDGFVHAHRGQPSENTMALSGALYWRTLRHVAHIGGYSRHQEQLTPIDLAVTQDDCVDEALINS